MVGVGIEDMFDFMGKESLSAAQKDDGPIDDRTK